MSSVVKTLEKERERMKENPRRVPARERRPDEVVIGKPVVENRDDGLPLRVFVVYGGLVMTFLLLLLLLMMSFVFIFLLVLGFGLSATSLLLLHYSSALLL